MGAKWLGLTPKPWRKRHRPMQPPIPPSERPRMMLWRIDPASPAADALRTLRTELERTKNGGTPKILAPDDTQTTPGPDCKG